MADFSIAYRITKKNEGGYSNNTMDKGGETFCGISRRFNPLWSGWPLVDEAKKENFNNAVRNKELLELVEKFFEEEYWNKLNLTAIKEQELANVLFDMAVNMGRKTTIKYLQRTLNILNRNGKKYGDLKVDGIIGGKTLNALNKSLKINGNKVLRVLKLYRGKHYIEIMEADPTQEEFIGWFER